MNRTGISPGKDAENSTDTLSLRLAFLPVACMHTTVTCTMPIMRLTAAAEAAFVPVWNLRDGLIASGLSVPRIVASGTPTFSILAKRSDIELGAGTTVLWDEGQKHSRPILIF